VNLFGINTELVIARLEKEEDEPLNPVLVDVRPGVGNEANLLLRLKHMLRHPIECEGGQRPVLHVDRGGWADIRVAAYLLQTTVPTIVSAIIADMMMTDVVTFEVAIYRPAPTKDAQGHGPPACQPEPAGQG
jgi:hypothetical protein